MTTECPRCNGIGKLTEYNLRCSGCCGTGSGDLLIRYAGIGSRETPEPVLVEMGNIAMQLALREYVLHSGQAKGADQAFERGCDMVKGRKIIRCATMQESAIRHASRYHPKWSACDQHTQALHARNSLVMLGDWLDTPVNFVVCWTPDGAVVGGTGQALRIAAAHEVPVFNLALDGAVARLWEWLG